MNLTELKAFIAKVESQPTAVNQDEVEITANGKKIKRMDATLPVRIITHEPDAVYNNAGNTPE